MRLCYNCKCLLFVLHRRLSLTQELLLGPSVKVLDQSFLKLGPSLKVLDQSCLVQFEVCCIFNLLALSDVDNVALLQIS